MTYFRSFTENMTFFPISPLLLQRFVRECSSLQSVRWRQKIGKQTAAGVFPCRCRFYQLICLFAAVQSVQERDDLCSRAVVWLAVPAGWLANFLVSYAALRKSWPTEKVVLSR